MNNNHFIYSSKGNKKIVLSFEDTFPYQDNEGDSNPSNQHNNHKDKEKGYIKRSTETESSDKKTDEVGKENKEKFKDKFEYEQRRKILDQVKEKYGKNLKSPSSSSASESEDSEADFVNPQVLTKFVDVISSLKDKSKKKELLSTDKAFFEEEDFKETEKKEKRAKPSYTVKDYIMDEANDDDYIDPRHFEKDENKDFNDINYIPVKQKDEFKESFLQASKNIDGEIKEATKASKGFLDDGFLIKKNTKTEAPPILDKKAKKKITLNDKPLEELDHNDLLKISGPNANEDILKSYWSKSNDLSTKDKFLRNFILTEAWKEKGETRVTYTREDEEDSEKSDIFDNFESAYNFRFQESGGINIMTHKRYEDESMRLKDNSRADKRKEVDQRKKQEKEERLKEINMARQLRKETYKDQINKFLKIAGKNSSDVSEKVLDKLYEELDNENFDPSSFDSVMNDIFNKDYYKVSNAHEEEELVKKNILEDEETKREIEEEMNEDYGGKKIKKNKNRKASANSDASNKNNNLQLNENKENEMNDEDNEDSEQETEWWFCDTCKNIIKPGKVMYISVEEDDDVTLCKPCFKNTAGVKKMKKQIVPLNTKIPDNWKELVAQATKEQEDNVCNHCNNTLEFATYYYICSESKDHDECVSLRFCKTCRGIGKSIHEHKLIKHDVLYEQEKDKDAKNKNKEESKDKVTQVLDKLNEKFDIVNDDIIGDLPTKFHYTNVKSDDFDLTDEMLLYLDDKTLNKFVPVKGLAPYREQAYKVNKFNLKKEMKNIRKEIERKREIINKELAEEEENYQKNNNLLGKKQKKNDESGDYRAGGVSKDGIDKKRLESYGIN